VSKSFLTLGMLSAWNKLSDSKNYNLTTQPTYNQKPQTKTTDKINNQ